MGRHLTNSGLILPVIRKVICRDDAYICSIRRTEYKTKVEANNCLNHCWYDVQELYPVVLRKLHGRYMVFRCHYCCRDYKDENEALTCARRCLGERNQIHVREQLLNDLPIQAPTHRPSRIRLVAMAAVPARPLYKPKVEEATEAAADVASESDVEIPADQPEVEAVAVAAPRRSKADFAKPWIRMDAKYQCACCKKQYFTKMEVETCFNGHFDAEGLEITE